MEPEPLWAQHVAWIGLLSGRAGCSPVARSCVARSCIARTGTAGAGADRAGGWQPAALATAERKTMVCQAFMVARRAFSLFQQATPTDGTFVFQ